MREAIHLAKTKMLHGHGGPFGCVIVKNGTIIGKGYNRVTTLNDPTAHAEVQAIREACKHLGHFELKGCDVYTSCEPCPMCLASSLWARLDRVVFAADRHDAARAGFDDAVFYEYFETPVEERSLQVTQVAVEDVPATAPFEAWTAAEDRIDY